jgi:hypothetical protein
MKSLAKTSEVPTPDYRQGTLKRADALSPANGVALFLVAETFTNDTVKLAGILSSYHGDRIGSLDQ